VVDFSYVDSALGHMENGHPPSMWGHLHWGLFDSPTAVGNIENYFEAAVAMTERVVAAAGVADRRDVLDVGCGFGGTLRYVRERNPGCRLRGVNIDERQLQWARRLVAEDEGAGPAAGAGTGAVDPISFVVADGCRLPVATASVDHVLAVECIFHFPSRKAFFLEVARVLRPGGTLALSDFVMADGALSRVAAAMRTEEVGEENWYGHQAKPLTSLGYARLAGRTGLALREDDDVNERSLPTYDALRALAAADNDSTEGLIAIESIEALARTHDLAYHVLSFTKPEA
jgi:SAM-dependent methyltransferase